MGSVLAQQLVGKCQPHLNSGVLFIYTQHMRNTCVYLCIYTIAAAVHMEIKLR